MGLTVTSGRDWSCVPAVVGHLWRVSARRIGPLLASVRKQFTHDAGVSF